jgi:hypothetical protein
MIGRDVNLKVMHLNECTYSIVAERPQHVVYN